MHASLNPERLPAESEAGQHPAQAGGVRAQGRQIQPCRLGGFHAGSSSGPQIAQLNHELGDAFQQKKGLAVALKANAAVIRDGRSTRQVRAQYASGQFGRKG
eukprot:scaffold22803_cov24-Tisochrysis_lutea.AAC.2